MRQFVLSFTSCAVTNDCRLVPTRPQGLGYTCVPVLIATRGLSVGEFVTWNYRADRWTIHSRCALVTLCTKLMCVLVIAVARPVTSPGCNCGRAKELYSLPLAAKRVHHPEKKEKTVRSAPKRMKNAASIAADDPVHPAYLRQLDLEPGTLEWNGTSIRWVTLGRIFGEYALVEGRGIAAVLYPERALKMLPFPNLEAYLHGPDPPIHDVELLAVHAARRILQGPNQSPYTGSSSE